MDNLAFYPIKETQYQEILMGFYQKWSKRLKMNKIYNEVKKEKNPFYK